MSSLLVTHGHHFGVRYSLLERTTLGRSSGCSIQLLDEKVSRLHSSITREGEQFILRDEGSSNGTGLNGRLLLESAVLQPGDEVAVGNNLMLFAPNLEIFRDLEGAGAVIAATPPESAAVSDEVPYGEETFRLESLLAGISELLAGPRGVGRPAALLEATATGLHGDRAALLVAPLGGEPIKAVATWPHRGRVCIARPLLQRLLDERRAVHREGTLELTVRQGRSLLESHGGSCLAIPISRGGRLRGLFYVEAARRNAFRRLPIDLVCHTLNVAFAPLFVGAPGPLRPERPGAEPPQPVAESPAMQEALELAGSFADTQTPVLLQGAPGSGKEFLARTIHRLGPRSQGPFIALHCGSLSRNVAESIVFGHAPGAFPGADALRVGLVEQADGGTLFLDDLGELQPPLQVRLLRLLQEGRVYRLGGTRPVRADIRIIAGTARDLSAMVRGGVLRADLHDHLTVTTLQVPPLADRLADVAPLVRHFIKMFNAEHGTTTREFSPEAVGHLEAHDWPGNVRQLRDVVHRASVRAREDVVDAATVRQELDALPRGEAEDHSPELVQAIRRIDREFTARALARCSGSLTRAARMLDISVPELDRRLVAWNLDLFGE